MALGAAAFSHLFGKLLAVRVFMALRADLLLNFQRDAWFRRNVAGATRRCHVFTVEHKRRGRVFGHAKKRRRKAFDRMALRTFAGLTGCKLTFVLVFMTGHARVKRQFAIPGVFRHRLEMALSASGLHVFAFKWVHRFLVCVATNFIGNAHPFDRAMAVVAVFAKRRFVHYRVATHALFAFGRWLVVAFIVAFFAFQRRVAVGQRQPRVVATHLGVVDIPALFVVTRSTGLRFERAVVWIFVTGIACRKRNAFPFRRRVVALLARHRHMLANQFKIGFVVVERVAVKVVPILDVVARLALAAELVLVWVFVTAQTLGFGVYKLGFAERRGFGMALHAGWFSVFAFERPAGVFVVEAVHVAARPTDQFGIAAQVFNVARLTSFTFGLPGVPASSSAYLSGQIFVAAVAQRCHHFFAGLVAF